MTDQDKDYVAWGTHLLVGAVTEVAVLLISKTREEISQRASELRKQLA